MCAAVLYDLDVLRVLRTLQHQEHAKIMYWFAKYTAGKPTVAALVHVAPPTSSRSPTDHFLPTESHDSRVERAELCDIQNFTFFPNFEVKAPKFGLQSCARDSPSVY